MAFKIHEMKQVSTQGVWADWMGAKWLIAKSGTDDHIATQELIFKPYNNLMNTPGGLAPEKRRELMAEVVAKCILVGWDENVLDEQDQPVAYSWQQAQSFLLQSPELLKFVSNFSINDVNYRAASVGETGKKSQTISDGTQNKQEEKSLDASS